MENAQCRKGKLVASAGHASGTGADRSFPSAFWLRHAPAPVELQLLAFAQARDLFGFSSRTVSCAPGDSPRAILQRLAPTAPLAHLRVALDAEYATWDTPVGAARELAILPPVSGG